MAATTRLQGFRLTVSSLSFTPEGDDPDGPHANAKWRLEFYPTDKRRLPREEVIFVACQLNFEVEDALENRILRTDEATKYGMIVDFAETTFREKGFYNFEIVNSQAVAIPAPVVDLPFDYPIVPYTSLEPCEGTIRAGSVHSLVKFEGKVYLLKGADFPGEEHRLVQELSHYKMVSRSYSRWIPEIGGIVCRQGRREAFLVRYYPGGDLTRHFDAESSTKRRWVIQIATALTELNSINFFHQDVKCANIVVDEVDDIRIIDLENAGVTDGWAHPDNLNPFMDAPEEKDPQPSTLPSIPERAHMNLFSIPSLEPAASPPVPEWAPITAPPVSEAVMSTLGFPPLFRSYTVDEKRRFQVYGFGKTVWELYVGKTPIDEDDLLQTPLWVQRLVRGCCKEDSFASMDEVLSYLNAQLE